MSFINFKRAGYFATPTELIEIMHKYKMSAHDALELQRRLAKTPGTRNLSGYYGNKEPDLGGQWMNTESRIDFTKLAATQKHVFNEYISELKSDMRVELTTTDNHEYYLSAFWGPNDAVKAETKVSGPENVSAAILQLKDMILAQKPMAKPARSFVNFKKLAAWDPIGTIRRMLETKSLRLDWNALREYMASLLYGGGEDTSSKFQVAQSILSANPDIKKKFSFGKGVSHLLGMIGAAVKYFAQSLIKSRPSYRRASTMTDMEWVDQILSEYAPEMYEVKGGTMSYVNFRKLAIDKYYQQSLLELFSHQEKRLEDLASSTPAKTPVAQEAVNDAKARIEYLREAIKKIHADMEPPPEPAGVAPFRSILRKFYTLEGIGRYGSMKKHAVRMEDIAPALDDVINDDKAFQGQKANARKTKELMFSEAITPEQAWQFWTEIMENHQPEFPVVSPAAKSRDLNVRKTHEFEKEFYPKPPQEDIL